ncbi:thioesterase family protein [Streptomyces sp. 6N223]|uniref:thioesterase family protein n=1 Tax=Streptomyces sp. 6N223 TaxID=3457412 RepID=UPI003FD1925B
MTAHQAAALTRSETVVVAPHESAEQWGNTGLDVLSTPAILGRVEQLCDAAMKPGTAPGEMTVGVSATMRHRAPVRVGSTVEYRVSAPAYARKTEFSFEVVAEDGTVVCDGRHERAVIDVEKFKQRLGT